MNTSYEQLIAPRLLDSRLKLHIVLQFLIHAQLATSAATLSDRLRENPWAVAEALAELADQNLLASALSQGKLIYRLGFDRVHLARLALLLEDFNDPLKRDQIHALVRSANRERQFRACLANDDHLTGQQIALGA
jgi:hypothetical protein